MTQRCKRSYQTSFQFDSLDASVSFGPVGKAAMDLIHGRTRVIRRKKRKSRNIEDTTNTARQKQNCIGAYNTLRSSSLHILSVDLTQESVDDVPQKSDLNIWCSRNDFEAERQENDIEPRLEIKKEPMEGIGHVIKREPMKEIKREPMEAEPLSRTSGHRNGVSQNLYSITGTSRKILGAASTQESLDDVPQRSDLNIRCASNDFKAERQGNDIEPRLDSIWNQPLEIKREIMEAIHQVVEMEPMQEIKKEPKEAETFCMGVVQKVLLEADERSVRAEAEAKRAMRAEAEADERAMRAEAKAKRREYVAPAPPVQLAPVSDAPSPSASASSNLDGCVGKRRLSSRCVAARRVIAGRAAAQHEPTMRRFAEIGQASTIPQGRPTAPERLAAVYRRVRARVGSHDVHADRRHVVVFAAC